MMKYVRGLALIMAGCLSLTSWSMSSPREDLTLVVIPERYSVIQVAFDLADRRAAVLIAYRGDAEGDPELYVWNGSEWEGLSVTAYSEASFLKVLPRKVILVGDETLLPEALAEGASWAPQVWQVPSIKTDDLVNAFGKIFKFRKSEWKWFAARYKLDLEDLNEDLRKDSWYYHPYIEDQPAPSVPAVPAVPAVSSVPAVAAESPPKVAPVRAVPSVDEVSIDLPEPVLQEDPDIEPIEDVQLPK